MRRLTPGIRLGLGLFIGLVAFIGLISADRGLQFRRFSPAGAPMTLVFPAPLEVSDDAEVPGHAPRSLPAVIVAHGFAASSKIMLGYAHVLAHAGYAVMLFDFSGHGGNATPFDRDEAGLAREVDRAYRTLVQQPEVDPTRVALLGHSMGTMAVISAARENPQRYRATVAVSPGRLEVTSLTPRNLQLQAGSAEPRFLRNAAHLLELAGGASEDLANGRARELVIVRRAEHVTIVFRDASHEAALRWLDATLGHDPTGSARRDRRIIWWALFVVGSLIALTSLQPLREPRAAEADRQRRVRSPLHWVGVLLAPLVASLVCAMLAAVVDLPRVAGLPIGGALALWMLIAGLFFLLLAYRAPLPSLAEVGHAIWAFGFLWLTFGLTAELVWLEWGLVGARAVRWPLVALACTPWFVAAELGQGDPRGRGRLLWWVAQSVSLTVGLVLLMRLTTGLDWLGLVLPLLPPILGVLAIVGSRVNRPWAYGFAAGGFFGWLIVATFPLLR